MEVCFRGRVENAFWASDADLQRAPHEDALPPLRKIWCLYRASGRSERRAERQGSEDRERRESEREERRREKRKRERLVLKKEGGISVSVLTSQKTRERKREKSNAKAQELQQWLQLCPPLTKTSWESVSSHARPALLVQPSLAAAPDLSSRPVPMTRSSLLPL